MCGYSNAVAAVEAVKNDNRKGGFQTRPYTNQTPFQQPLRRGAIHRALIHRALIHRALIHRAQHADRAP